MELMDPVEELRDVWIGCSELGSAGNGRHGGVSQPMATGAVENETEALPWSFRP